MLWWRRSGFEETYGYDNAEDFEVVSATTLFWDGLGRGGGRGRDRTYDQSIKSSHVSRLTVTLNRYSNQQFTRKKLCENVRICSLCDPKENSGSERARSNLQSTRYSSKVEVASVRYVGDKTE
jgi:hypothetical protein